MLTRIRHLLFDLALTLHVDIEQQVMANLFRMLQNELGSPIVFAKDLRIFQKIIARDHGLKFIARNEVVLAAILFAAARRARGVGDGKFQVRHVLAQFIHQRGFAGA